MTNGSKAKRPSYNDSLSYADEIQQLFVHCRQGNTEAVERWLATQYLNDGTAPQKGGQSPLKLLLFSTSSRRKVPLYELRDPTSGYSLLHQATLHGHLPIVELLKEREPRLLEVKDRRGCLPIQLAAWGGHEAVVEELLTPQTLNSVNNARESATHLASMRGHATVVELLLRAGGDVTLKNARHETALDVAARNGNAGVCKVLTRWRQELALQSAADCSTSKYPALYPLHAAARHGYTDCVKVLCQAGFDVNYVTEEGTALHVAALAGHIETVRVLLEQGADLWIRDSERRTVLEKLNERGGGENNATECVIDMIKGHPAALRPCPKPRKSVDEGRPIATSSCDKVEPSSATASYEAGSTWIPIPEGSIVRLNSIGRAFSKPAPAPRTHNTFVNTSINSVMSSSGAGGIDGGCKCSYVAPANYDAWAALTARPVYANAEPRPSTPEQHRLPINYDNVPRSLLVYDNAPPPGHRRWPHHCVPPPKPSHSASSTTSDAVVVSHISGSQSSSAANSATTGCVSRELSLDEHLQQIVVEGLLAPLARPEELSCSNSTNFSASLSPADGGDWRVDAREGTTSSEGIAEQKSLSTLVGAEKGGEEELRSAEAGGASCRTFTDGAMQCSLDSITSSCSLPAVSQLSTTPPSPSPIPIDDGQAQWKNIEELLGTLYDASDSGGRETKGAPKSELFYWLRDSVGLVGEIAPEAESRRLINNGFDRVDMLVRCPSFPHYLKSLNAHLIKKGSLTTLHMIEMGMPRDVQLRISDWLEHGGRGDGIRKLSDFDSLSDWMHALGLACHVACFKEVNLTDVSDIAAARLTRGDLEKMGVARLGHVSRILRSLALSGKQQNGGERMPSQCFTAHYLGSRNIHDSSTAPMYAEVTADHCRKTIIQLKKDLAPASMVPQVRLQISDRGVMLHGSPAAASGSVLHAAEQISGVCQDETDLNFFAYVHCDGVNESNCHVFCLLTANLAKDVITAIEKSLYVCNAVKDHTGNMSAHKVLSHCNVDSSRGVSDAFGSFFWDEFEFSAKVFSRNRSMDWPIRVFLKTCLSARGCETRTISCESIPRQDDKKMKFEFSRILLLFTLACLALQQASAESTLDKGDDGAGWLDESDVEGIEYMNSSEPTPHLTEFPPTFSASQMSDAESEAKKLSEGVECVPDAVCYKDQDCGTDNSDSFCAGSAAVGTCNCASCLTGKPCKDDSDCGGLMHACQADTTGLCNCRAAHKANGFPTYLSALQTFCNKRRCDDKSGDDVCLGLPCRNGLCVCP